MIKSASKYLFGLAAFGFVASIAYAAATGEHEIGMDTLLGPLTLGYKGYVGEHIGYSVLMSLSIVSLVLALFLTAVRDGDAEAQAEVASVETVPEVPVPVTVNYWPVIAAFSAGAVVLGLAIGSQMFVLGMVGLAICAIEWAAQAWSDRATGDPEVNRTIRNRLMHPVEVPLAAVLGIAVIVLATSRILLALPKIGSYLVFGLVPAAVLVVGAIIVLKPKTSQSFIAGVCLFGGVALLGGGVWAAIAGEREHHGGEEHHEETDAGHEGEEGLAPLPGPGDHVIQVAD